MENSNVNKSTELVANEHNHFHSSGEPKPSREDSHITGRIKEAGVLLGIELLDHIVIGSEGRYVSFREEGIEPFGIGGAA